METDDSLQIRCPKCKSKFRDRARRVLSGYSRQCPACECMIFFEDGAPNADISDALREAALLRKALRDEQAEAFAERAASAAEQAAADNEDGDEDDGQSSAPSRYSVNRRSGSPLRARLRPGIRR